MANSAKNVALYDGLGRFLSRSTDGRVLCDSGVALEQSLVHMTRVTGTQQVVISFPEQEGYVRYDVPSDCFVCAPGLAAATVFTIHAQPGSWLVSCAFEVRGAVKYLAAAQDGSVLASPFVCDFAVVVEPVMGLVTAAYASRSMDGRWVSIWAGPDRGWVCPHPPHLFGGGEVKSRVARMCDWERFQVKVADPEHGVVALQSSHGRWLCHMPSGALVCDKREVGQWEVFTLLQVAPAEVAIVSCAHNNSRTQYVSAMHEGMDCTRTAIGDCERFMLLDAGEARRRYTDTNPSFDLRAERDKGTTALSIASIVGGVILGAAVVAGGLVAAQALADAGSVAEAMRLEAAYAREAAARAQEDADMVRAVASDVAQRTAAEDRVKAAVEVLKRGGTDAAGVCAALRCIHSDAEAFITARRAAVDFGGLVHIIASVTQVETDAAVSRAGLLAFTALSVTSTENVILTTPDALAAALRAAYLHMDVPDTILVALHVVSHLCRTSRGQEGALQANGPQVCVSALRKGVQTGDAALTCAALEACEAMAVGEKTANVRVVNSIIASNGVALITSVLHNRDMPRDALVAGLAVLSQLLLLSSKAGESVVACAVAGVMDALVQVRAAHAEDEGVVLYCLLSLGVFSQRVHAHALPTHASLLASGAPAGMLPVQGQFPTNPAIAACWCTFYAGLAESKLAPPVCVDAVPLVHRAMQVKARTPAPSETQAVATALCQGGKFLTAMGVPHQPAA